MCSPISTCSSQRFWCHLAYLCKIRFPWSAPPVGARGDVCNAQGTWCVPSVFCYRGTPGSYSDRCFSTGPGRRSSETGVGPYLGGSPSGNAPPELVGLYSMSFSPMTMECGVRKGRQHFFQSCIHQSHRDLLAPSIYFGDCQV